MNTTIYKTESNVYETVSEAEKARLEKSVQKSIMNSVYGMHGQAAKFKRYTNKDPEGGFKRNEMVFVTSGRARVAFNKSQLSMADKELKQKLNDLGLTVHDYTSSDPEYRALIEAEPCVKEAVMQMQSAIDRSVFKGVIGVGIQVSGEVVYVHRYYISTKRFGNRVKAYSERYEELRKHLVPTEFIE